MEKVFVPERNVTISTVVPLSLKNRLLMEASKLGISLSEFLFHLIENSGCNAFSANEIQQKNIEIQNLQNQITELETKLQELENLQSEFEQDLRAEVATSELLQETEQAPKPKTEVKALPTAEPKTEVKTLPTAEPNLQYVPKSKEEAILHELYEKGVRHINRPELKALGFNTGFWGKLTVRGAKYGAYGLTKNFSEQVFKIVKNDEKTAK